MLIPILPYYFEKYDWLPFFLENGSTDIPVPSYLVIVTSNDACVLCIYYLTTVHFLRTSANLSNNVISLKLLRSIDLHDSPGVRLITVKNTIIASEIERCRGPSYILQNQAAKSFDFFCQISVKNRPFTSHLPDPRFI